MNSIIPTEIHFGIEIEAGWKPGTHWSTFNDPSMVLLTGWDIKNDGSIHGLGNSNEFTTGAYSIHDMEKFKHDIQKIMQHVNRINKSCGLHIHLSFSSPIYYFLLSTAEFNKFFMDKFITKYSREECLRLHNTYCSSVFTKQENSNRYKAINCQAYSEWKTIEFRLFRATTKWNKIVKNVEFLVKTIDQFVISRKDYLNKLKRNGFVLSEPEE